MMKLSRELKNIINKIRSARGKKNGVIRWLYEGSIERKVSTNKHLKANHDKQI